MYTSLNEVKEVIKVGITVNWQNGNYIVKIDFYGDLVVKSSNGLGGEILTEAHLKELF